MNRELFEKQSKERQHGMVQTGITIFSKLSYQDAATDEIVKQCGISKGLLFHYFGSKKDFYLYCLDKALHRLIKPCSAKEGDFYQIIFSVMNDKIQICKDYPLETHFVNMASKEEAAEVKNAKKEIFLKYRHQTELQSGLVMQQAIGTLPLKDANNTKVQAGVLIYCNAIISRYLLQYQDTPDIFFERQREIQDEMKEYMDMLLYGIVR